MEQQRLSTSEQQRNFDERRAMSMSKQIQEQYDKIEEVRAFEMATIILAKEYAAKVSLGEMDGLYDLNAKVDLMAKQLSIKHL